MKQLVGIDDESVRLVLIPVDGSSRTGAVDPGHSHEVSFDARPVLSQVHGSILDGGRWIKDVHSSFHLRKRLTTQPPLGGGSGQVWLATIYL